MNWASRTVNGVLSRLGLHLSRTSSHEGLLSAFAGVQSQAAELQSKLDETLVSLKVLQEKAEHERLLQLSKVRWRSDEPDAGLTWGVTMVGDEFVRFLTTHVSLKPTSTIVEVGPGYGRILDTLLKQGIPFRRYIGLEISPARVGRLSEQFQSDRRIEFREADVLGDLDLNALADLTFSSAVFEHLYPDFGAAIRNISRFTRPGGATVIDFIRNDETLASSAAWFEKETYMRVYSSTELRVLFEKSSFVLNDIARISFGRDNLGREIARTVVYATKGAPGTTLESVVEVSTQKTFDVSPFETYVHRIPPACDHRTFSPPVTPAFRSPFGGLWTDLNNAEAVLAGKVALGELLPAEAKLVDAWIRDGFVILPGAVDAAAIDAALVDFERAYDGDLHCKMSYWGDQGLVIEDARREHLRKTQAKLLDLHDGSEAVQAILFAEPLSRFMAILFERPSLAFQSLGFYYGSQQSIHQDSAFVRVNSPLEFIASWIALEDIRPGSGELEYYPGSHAIPHYLFGGSRLWADHYGPEVDKFSDNLHAGARQAGLSLQRFLPKKGDVLFWSAGLMHGGSPVRNPELTRKSLVTHYCPADLQPMYAYKGGRPKRKSLSGHYVMAERWE